MEVRAPRDEANGELGKIDEAVEGGQPDLRTPGEVPEIA
jgi:hypothetical protein